MNCKSWQKKWLLFHPKFNKSSESRYKFYLALSPLCRFLEQLLCLLLQSWSPSFPIHSSQTACRHRMMGDEPSGSCNGGSFCNSQYSCHWSVTQLLHTWSQPSYTAVLGGGISKTSQICSIRILEKLDVNLVIPEMDKNSARLYLIIGQLSSIFPRLLNNNYTQWWSHTFPSYRLLHN